jgi:hypothetical protein
MLILLIKTSQNINDCQRSNNLANAQWMLGDSIAACTSSKKHCLISAYSLADQFLSPKPRTFDTMTLRIPQKIHAWDLGSIEPGARERKLKGHAAIIATSSFLYILSFMI